MIPGDSISIDTVITIILLVGRSVGRSIVWPHCTVDCPTLWTSQSKLGKFQNCAMVAVLWSNRETVCGNYSRAVIIP